VMAAGGILALCDRRYRSRRAVASDAALGAKGARA